MKLAQVEKQWPDVGGGDLYYGGTAYDNTAGLGVQLPSGTERGEGISVNPVVRGERAHDSLVAVPITLLYDRGTTFVCSHLMHPRIPGPYVEINAADAARLGVADGEPVTLVADGKEMRVTARVDGRAPEGALLVPQSLGGPVLNRQTVAAVKKG
jgi:anaerobic selenocysteine-containing dehydrogenase